MSLNEAAQKIAQALLSSKMDSFGETFNIDTDEANQVIVLVVKRPKRVKLGNLNEWTQRIQFQDSGNICSRCSGTGRE